MEKNNQGIFGKARVETLSDGIFAILLTLLVLEIRVPHIEQSDSVPELLTALSALLPKILSWVLSFFTICVIWVNHHRLFKMFKELDHGLFWINAMLLLFVSFIPFPTALMGDYIDNRLAVSLYGIVLGLMGISFVVMRVYALNRPQLLNAGVDVAHLKAGTVYVVLFSPLPYFGAAALAWAHPLIPLVVYLAIPLYFLTPHSTAD